MVHADDAKRRFDAAGLGVRRDAVALTRRLVVPQLANGAVLSLDVRDLSQSVTAHTGWMLMSQP